MQKYLGNVASSVTGLPVMNSSVQVNTWPGAAAATIYSDNGVTQTANPLTTDANGNFAFYAANGHYQLVISGSNISTQTINDIILLDILPADLPTNLPGTAGQPWNNGGVISVS